MISQSLNCLLPVGSWHLEDLSQKVKVQASVLRKRIMFWVSHGLINETGTDYFTIIENLSDNPAESRHQYLDECEDDENESAMASASDQREEELKVFLVIYCWNVNKLRFAPTRTNSSDAEAICIR